MKDKVLFVVLPLYTNYGGEEKKCPSMPYGVLSISKYIKDISEVKIFDCNLYDDHSKALEKTLKEFSPTIVGFSMMYDSCFNHLEKLVGIVKKYNQFIPIFLGGTGTFYVYNDIKKKISFIDAICYRDGEVPMRQFIEHRLYSDSWVIDSNQTPKKSMIENLDEIIDIDYSLVDIKAYQHGMISENFSPFVDPDNTVQLYMMGSRGCNFSCTFCANSKNPDKKIRHASIRAIRNHIERLINEYGMNVLSLYDEQLLANKEWAKELFQMLSYFNLVIKIPGGITPLYVDEELVDLMWDAGVDAVGIALESGSEKILKLMKKPVNLNKVRKIMPYLRKYNFWIRAFLVIGIPGETDEDRELTLDFIREIQPDVIAPTIASPILGSKLRDECIEKGYIKTVELGKYDKMVPMIDTEEYSSEHIKKWYKQIIHQINFIENYRMKIGDYKTAIKYFQYVINKYPHEFLAKKMIEECRRRQSDR